MDRGQFSGAGGPRRAWIPALTAGIWLLVSSSLALATQGGVQGQEITARSWENYFGVSILPSNRVVVVGDKGVVMTSDDQGRTWTSHQLKKGEKFFDLYSVAFAPDGSAGWVVGDGGAVFHTSDKGSTWTLQNSSTNAALLKVAAVDAQKACAVGEQGVVVCTGDGGSNWNLQKVKDLVYFDVAFTDANNGWAVGEFKTTIHTSDGGKTWTIQSGGERLATADPYFAIAFENPTRGIVLGLTGNSVETADGGRTWKNDDLPNWHDSLFAVAPLASQGSNDFYAGGENGAMARIENGKASLVNSGTSNAITALAFSSHEGIAVGLGGTILRSEDGGTSWQVLDGGHITEARGQ